MVRAVEGQEADTRSDIWAFGAVLYEMVTGEKAFQAKVIRAPVVRFCRRTPTDVGEAVPRRRRWNGW